MRALLLAMLLLASSFVAPSASAAGPLFTDPAGDVQVTGDAAGTALPGAPLMAGGFEKASDLVALDVTETEDELVFTLTVASTTNEPSGIQANVLLTWGAKDYRLVMGFYRASGALGQTFDFAYLQAREGNGWESAADLEDPVIDATTGTIRAALPKVYLFDEQKRAPGRGDTLVVNGVIADTSVAGSDLLGARLYDAMPDEPGARATFTLALGDSSQGSLVLSAPERVRVSNGGATTFVYQLTLRNLAGTAQEFALAAEDLPAGWNATLPTSAKVAANADTTVSVLVSVPFAHEHGGYSSFNVTARSTSDPATSGRLRLGVVHTPIPQPAGHHSELFLHARDPRSGTNTAFSNVFPFAQGWMNTQEDHAEDASFISPRSEDGNIVWWIRLDPSLQVGLDFDITVLGAFEGVIQAHRDAEAELTADLYYYVDHGGDWEETLLAEGSPTAIALAQSAPSPFKLTLTPTLDADYIAYTPDAGMYLKVSLTGANVLDEAFNTPLRAQLDTAGAKLSLPLNEYHDRLSGEADIQETIEIVANDLVEKAARPGSILTYPFTVKNTGAPATFVFDLAGNHVAHARLVPRGEFALDTGEAREVTLAVEIPVDANIGQEYEVLLFVHGRDDPSKMAVARTKTRASDAADAMGDESAELLAAQARENQTPGAPLFLLAGALAVAALARRR